MRLLVLSLFLFQSAFAQTISGNSQVIGNADLRQSPASTPAPSVYVIGYGTVGGGNSTIPITTTNSVPAGGGIVVVSFLAGSNFVSMTCSDSASDTYQQDLIVDEGTDCNHRILSAACPTGLSTGSTITPAWASGTPGGVAVAYAISQLKSSAWRDVVATNTQSFGTTCATGTTAAAAGGTEVDFCVVTCANNPTSVTWVTATNVGLLYTYAGNRYMQAAVKINSAATAQSDTATYTGGGNGGPGSICVYKTQ